MGSPSSDSLLEDDLIEAIRSRLLDLSPSFDSTSDLFAAGLDSMSIMHLLLLIEERYGTSFSPAEVSRENLATPHALANLIRQRRRQPNP
jgi:acyl carrier protein